MLTSSSSSVRLAALEALAFTFVPSPATRSTVTRPSRAQMASTCTNRPVSASLRRRTKRATAAWPTAWFPVITRQPTSSKQAICTARDERIPLQ